MRIGVRRASQYIVNGVIREEIGGVGLYIRLRGVHEKESGLQCRAQEMSICTNTGEQVIPSP